MRKAFRPSVDQLDRRLVPSSCRHVVVVTDPLAQSGEGSLVAIVDNARPDTTVRFAAGIRAVLVLEPLVFKVRGLEISGGPKGVLLLTDAPLIFTRAAAFNRVAVIPFSN